MTIVATPLFEHQLETLLTPAAETDPAAAKSFKLYLDTVLLNIPTKAKKYKPSLFFDDAAVKDVEHRGLIIPFYYDEAADTYVVLGIVPKPQTEAVV